MRLAIFGGSFDPPHIGHLLSAEDAYERLRLDRLIFVPAAVQPLKTGREATAAEHRLAMVRLLVSDDSRLEVSTAEIERGGLSFMVDTLGHFASAYPDAERFLLLGADVLATFGQWRDPSRVLGLAQPVILERNGEAQATLPGGLDEGRLMRLPTRRIDISSTEIRERVRQGRSIRGFVTENVAAYIHRAGLYR